MLVYISTAAKNPSENGIYGAHVNPTTGELSEPAIIAKFERSSYFFALHPNRRFLYAVSEDEQRKGDDSSGLLSAYAINRGSADMGTLSPINARSTGGKWPCHVSIDPTGRCALVSNYVSGSVAALPINPAVGSLGEASAVVQHHGSSVNPERQKGTFAHSFDADPTNRYALACDLGIDKVVVYRFDAAKGTLAPNDPPAAGVAPGSGPRHLAFHPNGRWIYVANELLNTVTVFAWDSSNGTLRELQTISALPAGGSSKTTYAAEIAVHPSGEFVYSSNRGHDSIAVFAVDTSSGRLTARAFPNAGGETPQHFEFDPSGKFLLVANQASEKIVVFRVDPVAGDLTPTGASVPIPGPCCVRFMPTE